jgi:hypothetical protein
MPRPLTLENADPLGDIAGIVSELTMRGMNAYQSVFLAYFIRFASAPAAEAAADAARCDGWSTCCYQTSTGLVVRLARQGPARAADLEADRDYLHGFADRHDGRWEGLALEDLVPDRYWERIAERFIARAAEPELLTTRREESPTRRRKSA